jgi:hypothetical protein
VAQKRIKSEDGKNRDKNIIKLKILNKKGGKTKKKTKKYQQQQQKLRSVQPKFYTYFSGIQSWY